jgi:hypothetical protein
MNITGCNITARNSLVFYAMERAGLGLELGLSDKRIKFEKIKELN